MPLTGRIKTLSPKRGYGFITDEAGGPDCFLHASELVGARIHALRCGMRVTFEIGTGADGRPRAVNARVVPEQLTCVSSVSVAPLVSDPDTSGVSADQRQCMAEHVAMWRAVVTAPPHVDPFALDVDAPVSPLVKG